MENAFLSLKIPNTQGVVGHRRDFFLLRKNLTTPKHLKNSESLEALHTYTDPSALGGDLRSGTGLKPFIWILQCPELEMLLLGRCQLATFPSAWNDQVFDCAVTS